MYYYYFPSKHIYFLKNLDDGRIIALDSVECQAKTNIVILLFQLYGFNINMAKSNLTPSTRSIYQGFITDTQEMKYYCSLDKEAKYKRFISDVSEFHEIHGYVSAKDLASVLGKINSLTRSHGSICRIMLRNSQHSLGKAVQLFGWDCNVILNIGLIEL